MDNNRDVKDVLNKYGGMIESQMGSEKNYSRDYTTFREEMSPKLTGYEKWCRTLGSAFRLKISEKERKIIQKDLDTAHLNVEAWQASTLSFMAFFAVFLFGFFSSVAYYLIKGGNFIDTFPFLFFFLILILALFLYYYIGGIPARLANQWRLKASSQMVPAILYIVVYMRHTPNLEKAIAFASDHLPYPLSLDFKKIFYDVEIGKFSTIKDSLDNYLENWRGYSSEFIESFHLIESSLFEPDQGRRITTLEKGLQVVLDGVYDKMLKFTHDVKSPLTNVYMLGVVLPTLGLALLPLASAMIGGVIKWYHVLLLYNLIIPFFVFYLVDKIMFLRPGGYGESEFLETNPLYPKYISNRPFFIAGLICFPFILLAFLPLIFQYTPLPALLGLPTDFTFAQIGLSSLGGTSNAFDFQNGLGPYGVGALLLSMFLPLGGALFFSIAYSMKTKELIVAREETRELEKEFNGSLFQLGNRLGNGVPPELVFAKVAESSEGLRTADFFRRVNYNISQMGMSVDKAIFDPKRGALKYYPSDLIATSMKILVESSKKGLMIAATSLMSISEYIKNINKISDRLRDLLAEIISDMKSNMTFLAPLLSGIVVGLASMIISILNKLNLDQMLGGGADSSGLVGTLSTFVGSGGLFSIEKMIPPYYLQLAIGVYLIEITFILTSALVTIDSGQDKLEKTNKTGKNLQSAILLYFITAVIATIALFALVSMVLGGVMGT